MAVKFRKQAIKFLEKANSEELENIRNQIKIIMIAVEEQGIIPFTDLDIKTTSIYKFPVRSSSLTSSIG